MPAKIKIFSAILITFFLLLSPTQFIWAHDFEPNSTLNQTILNQGLQGMGQCWWINPDILAKDYIGWGYDVGYNWRLIEPQEGTYDFSYFEESLAKIRAKNKSYLLYFLTGGGDDKGTWNPPWLVEKIRSRNPSHLIGNGNLIAPWDEDWQAALDKLARALAEKYDNDPNIVGVVVPSGCLYGEMSCNPGNDAQRQEWMRAGYTDDKFTLAVEQTVDNFLKYFQHQTVIVQQGGGLNGQRQNTGYKVMADMLVKYGTRVGHKFNGWGSGQGPEGNIDQWFSYYGEKIPVGYEVGVEENFSSPTFAKEKFTQAFVSHVSYGCLGDKLLSKTEGTWTKEYADFSRYSGTHIILNQAGFSATAVNPEQDINFTASFTNRGTKPLVAAKRVGVKDEMASYAVAVYFLPKGSGQETKRFFTPTTSTTQWLGGKGKPNQDLSFSVKAPAYGGQYEVRLALENPYEGPHQGETWGIITNKSGDARYRYLLGEIQVSGEPPPPSLSLGWGRNVVQWNRGNLSLSQFFANFSGVTWISRLLNGLWQTAVGNYSGETFPVQNNTTYTFTKATTSYNDVP